MTLYHSNKLHVVDIIKRYAVEHEHFCLIERGGWSVLREHHWHRRW